MARFQLLHQGDSCPLCKEAELKRIKRKIWMHCFPLSKHYICSDCYHRFLTVYGHLLVTLPKDENFLKPKLI
jgi:hypothetical protein